MTRDRRVAFWLLGLAVFIALLFVLSDVLMPFVAGMAVAYFLDPVVDRLERWGTPRGLATALVLVAFIAMAAAVVALVFPLVQVQVVDFLARLPDYVAAARRQLEPVLETLQAELTPGQVDELRDAAGAHAGAAIEWIGGLLGGILGGGAALLGVLSLVLITPLVTFYLLRDWDRIVVRIDGWLPRASAPTIRAQVAEIDRTLAGFVRGQASVCLILAAGYAIGLTLVGLEFGLVVGLVAGLISFIPYFGALVGLAVGLGLALGQFTEWTPIALVATVFAVGQVIEGSLLTPKLVGGRVGLHPVWVIFALLTGGALFGFTGVLLAVPAAAVIGVLTRFALERYLHSRLYDTGDDTGDDAGAGDGPP